MSYTIDVYLRDTRDGYTDIFHDDTEYTEEDPFDSWIWREGNYSCDCNRILFLYNWDEDKDCECNYGDNIIVIDKIVRSDTGEVLYRDEDNDKS